ncbi:MAG: glycosyltransferase [Syntrophorhabdus sp.]|nr:glycosyltransferase [Syntrophorhabdus sp.]
MESNRQPLISVITASMNSGSTIQHCIDSVKKQSYRNIDFIIMDGASTDDTVDIIKRNEGCIAYWESREDKGIYHAWNKALEHARGDWIIFLGTDDFLWGEDSLQELVSRLPREAGDYRVLYCRVMMVNKNGDVLQGLGEPWKRTRKRFLQVMCIPHPAAVYHKSMFEVHGKFDESFRIAGDYEFLLRELTRGETVYLEGITLTGMHHGGISSNPANSVAALREIRTAQKKHGFRSPGFLWIMAYIRVQTRLILGRLVGLRNASVVFDLGRRLVGKKPFWTRI